MGHQGDIARGFDPADKEKMIAVALGREVLDGVAHALFQERVVREGRQHIGRRPQLFAARPAATAEMREPHRGIERRFRREVAKDRHRERAADVGRVHARMNCILGRDNAADRNGAGRRPCRTGVGHDGAGAHGRHAHELDHVLLDGGDIGDLVGVLRRDVQPMGQRTRGTQRRGRSGQAPVDRRRDRGAKPAARLVATGQQRLARDLVHVGGPFCRRCSCAPCARGQAFISRHGLI